MTREEMRQGWGEQTMVLDGAEFLYLHSDHPVMWYLRTHLPQVIESRRGSRSMCQFGEHVWWAITWGSYKECLGIVVTHLCRLCRAQRHLRAGMARKRALAVAMAVHGRLGEASGLSVLGADLVDAVVRTYFSAHSLA